MNTIDALLTRRTIHDYLDKPVDNGPLEQALKAAVRAPNHRLTNPWRFTRVGPTVRHQLVDLGVAVKTENKTLTPGAIAKIRTKLATPPELFIVSQIINKDPAIYKEDYAAIACAIENFSLSLWSEGVGSKWSSGKLTQHEKTYRLANIDPTIEEIVGFVWVGYPARIPQTARLPLEQVLRHTD